MEQIYKKSILPVKKKKKKRFSDQICPKKVAIFSLKQIK